MAGGWMRDSFDVIVVGAGYVGSCAAYHLSKAGLKTAMIDRGLFAAAASRANFGNVQIMGWKWKKALK